VPQNLELEEGMAKHLQSTQGRKTEHPQKAKTNLAELKLKRHKILKQVIAL
jgi:hypothetical protein